jgi:hypothetical protein
LTAIPTGKLLTSIPESVIGFWLICGSSDIEEKLLARAVLLE